MTFNRDEFRSEIGSWDVPPPNVIDVMGRGRKAKRRLFIRRTATATVAAAVAVAGVWVAPKLLDREQQVTVPDMDQVSKEEDAKAVTFAFRALQRTGPYDLDYRGFTKANGIYIVRFLDGIPKGQLRQMIENQQLAVERHQLRRELLQERLEALYDSLSGCNDCSSDVERELDVKVKRVRDQLNSIDGAIEHFTKQARELEVLLEEQERTGGPHEITLTVERDGGVFRVENVSGPLRSLGADHRAEVENYEEPVPEHTSGFEFYDSKYRARGRRMLVEMRGFYGGPIPSSERVRCTATLEDPEGRPIYRSISFQGERGMIFEASSSESARDTAFVTFGLERVGPRNSDEPSGRHKLLEPLSLQTSCIPQVGSWEAVGETAILPVREGDLQEGSSYPLDPNRHVFVQTTVRFVGKPYTNSQTLCIATIRAADGRILDRHGMTIYGPSVGQEIARPGSEERTIRIAVIADDPDAIAEAAIECDPPLPGGSGPDR